MTENIVERRRSVEAKDRGRESREHIGEDDPELRAAASMERADFLVKEVKQGKKQMQNILLHMQEVRTAIAELRKALSLVDPGGDPQSLIRDQEKIDELKKTIARYQDELKKMRSDLVREEIETLKQGIGVGLPLHEVEARAIARVDELIGNVGGNE